MTFFLLCVCIFQCMHLLASILPFQLCMNLCLYNNFSLSAYSGTCVLSVSVLRSGLLSQDWPASRQYPTCKWQSPRDLIYPFDWDLKKVTLSAPLLSASQTFHLFIQPCLVSIHIQLTENLPFPLILSKIKSVWGDVCMLFKLLFLSFWIM